MRTCLLAFAVVAIGCGDDAPSEPDAGPPEREVVVETAVDGSGLSPEVSFTIPEDTRSVTIVIEGDVAAIYGLGAFALGDAVDLPSRTVPVSRRRLALLAMAVGGSPQGLRPLAAVSSSNSNASRTIYDILTLLFRSSNK